MVVTGLFDGAGKRVYRTVVRGEVMVVRGEMSILLVRAICTRSTNIGMREYLKQSMDSLEPQSSCMEKMGET